MTRKERIDTALNTDISLTAFEGQMQLMNSFREQYLNNGDLSDRQIEVAEKIIEQNSSFSQTWRNSRATTN